MNDESNSTDGNKMPPYPTLDALHLLLIFVRSISCFHQHFIECYTTHDFYLWSSRNVFY